MDFFIGCGYMGMSINSEMKKSVKWLYKAQS